MNMLKIFGKGGNVKRDFEYSYILYKGEFFGDFIRVRILV